MFFSLFALAPFSKARFIRYLLYIYSLISAATVCSIIISMLLLDIPQTSSLSAVVSYLFITGANATHLVILIQSYLCRFNNFRLFEKFSKIDLLLMQKLNIKRSYKTEVRLIRLKIHVILFLSLSTYVILTSHLIAVGQMNIFWSYAFYSIAIIRIKLLHVLFYVFLLKNRLNAVSDALNEFLIEYGARKTIK